MKLSILVGRDTWNLEIDRATKSVVVVSIDENTKPQPMRGLGDAIAKATTAVGIKPCGGCKQRQEALNKLVPFGNANEEGKNDGTASV
jgi:hypothetical protein